MNGPAASSLTPRAILALLVLALLAAAGCSSDTVLQPQPEPGGPTQLEILYGTDATVLAAPVHVDSAWADAGQLLIAVSYTGNCREHSFRALAPPAFLQQGTPVLPLYLQHLANGDSCAAHQATLLRVDARESEALYRYHHAGALQSYILRVIAPADSASPSTVDVPYSPTGSPEVPEDREAEQAAIHLSGALTAPEDLRRSIRDDLVAIRNSYRSEIHELDEISLVSPMRTDAISLTVDSPTAQAIAAGTYRAWDALNAEFRLLAIDPGSGGDYRGLTLRFWKNWHTGKVAQQYATLEGVTGVQRLPSIVWFTDPQYEVDLRVDADRCAYLFMKSWGDCPSGCIENHWWYFNVDAAGIRYLGFWDFRGGGPLPSWWDDARQTRAAWLGIAFEPWDGATQVSVGGVSPTWSPDGTRLAYALNTSTTCTIWSIARDGSDRQAIATLPYRIADLEWSPDGTCFVYWARDDVWVMSRQGGTPTQLTTDPASDRQPTWSPDGLTIAFVSTRAGSPDIWLIPAAGGMATRVLGSPRAWEDQPAWSPDGKRLAYRFWYGNSARANIWTVSIDGSNPQQITFDIDVPFDGSWDGMPAWSPDGQSTAFAGYRPTQAIWLVPSTGGTLQRLTFPGGVAPAWSPSGDCLAFEASRGGAEGVWVLNLRSAATGPRQSK